MKRQEYWENKYNKMVKCKCGEKQFEKERIIYEKGFEEGYAIAKRLYKPCKICPFLLS